MRVRFSLSTTPFGAGWVRAAVVFASALAMLAAVLTTASTPAAAAVEDVEIFSLSNRADLVSGGDAVLEVLVPDGADTGDLVIDVDGRDVTEHFATREDGRFAGLVDGLALGPNTVTARLPDGSGARLVVTNHPRGGPIFSGPQIQPWYCLEQSLDAQCNRDTTVTYQYKSAVTGQFATYDPESPAPDVASTTTDEGETVPYIVRVEAGTLNRSRYTIAILSPPDEEFTRWTGPVGWNHKVYVTHGAGCATGHSEGNAPGVMNDLALSRGFAVASHALTDNTESCNPVVQAESAMMVKERVTELYGDIRYQMGVGCSGGSIAQLVMANAYPGIYDGLIVSCTYPDIPTLDLVDCPALIDYFTDPTQWEFGVVWTEAHMSAATTQQSFSVCLSWLETFSPIFDPTRGANCDVPDQEPDAVYHPTNNPTGVRCTFQDYLSNLVGFRPPERWGDVEQQIGQGFANRFYDNVGLQYGLRGLLAGELTPAQFVDLNAGVGAMDIDYVNQDARIEADPVGLAMAYRSGVFNQAHNLDQVPIIDMPVPADRYEFHDNYKSWGLRQRLINANGHADNHLIWYGPDENGSGYADSAQPFDAMDEWLTGVTADNRAIDVAQKVVDNRPEGAGDRCSVPDESTCDLVFGSAGNIRYGAGAPTLANDVIKCHLKPLVRNEYTPVQFTDPQWERLQIAFPDGVCDWTRPGIGQQPAVPWSDYSQGPGGRALGDAPVSVPFGPGGINLVRFGGANRIQTAAVISAADLDMASTVVLANATAFPDALTGSPLAAQLAAPLLLSTGDRLSAETGAEITRLGATEAIVLGGTAVMSTQLVEDLSRLDLDVRRIAGANRFETAAAVAAEVAPAGVNEAVVVRGDDFPDAVAAAGMASVLTLPILLVESDRLPEPTAAALAGSRSATLVGGTAAISDGVASSIGAIAGTTTRLAGSSRYGTSAAVAEAALDRGINPLITWVATGEDFADALVSGAATGRDRGLLLLVDPQDLNASPETRDILAGLDTVAQIRIAGGRAAVSTTVANQLRAISD